MRALLALVLSCTLFAGPRVTFVGDSLMVALSPGLTAALGPSVVNLHQKSGSHLTQWLKVYPEADLACADSRWNVLVKKWKEGRPQRVPAPHADPGSTP